MAASRRHLTERYAPGADRLRWQAEKRFIPDAAVISLVTDAAMAGLADALDLGAALVLVQAGRLSLNGLEYGSSTARIRRARGARRWPPSWGGPTNFPPAPVPRLGRRPGPAAGPCGRRIARPRPPRRRQLSEPDRGEADTRCDYAERAAARAREARLLADEAAERVSLSLIHAAAALDRFAARCADLSVVADENTIRLLRHRAEEYHRTAVSYREMAARYGKLADGSG